jgi:alkanesulfonate monooxygenase SsuD/methylene tetrahydromethanopterin reductase-like flavin-dependent oxidoreductase (luciferase family)
VDRYSFIVMDLHHLLLAGLPAHFESYFPGRVLMGGPKQAIERIKVLRDVGITQIGMLVDFGSLPQAEIMRSLEIFAREVLPQVRDL